MDLLHHSCLRQLPLDGCTAVLHASVEVQAQAHKQGPTGTLSYTDLSHALDHPKRQCAQYNIRTAGLNGSLLAECACISLSSECKHFARAAAGSPSLVRICCRPTPHCNTASSWRAVIAGGGQWHSHEVDHFTLAKRKTTIVPPRPRVVAPCQTKAAWLWACHCMPFLLSPCPHTIGLGYQARIRGWRRRGQRLTSQPTTSIPCQTHGYCPIKASVPSLEASVRSPDLLLCCPS